MKISTDFFLASSLDHLYKIIDASIHVPKRRMFIEEISGTNTC